MSVRTGVRLGIDVGRARIGVARSDPHAMLATPVETVARDADGSRDVARIIEVVREYEAIEVVIGLPLNLRGERTPSTDDAVNFAERVATALAQNDPPVESTVRLVDERLSTVSAQGHLRQAGRSTKQSRGVIDQAAAVVILQHALDSERAQGVPSGNVVEAASLAAVEPATGDDDAEGPTT